MIVSDHKVGHWVAKKVFGSYNEANSQAIGLERNGVPVAGVIYENWNKKSIVCHIAIDGRINSRFLWSIFHYPFKFIGVEKIIAPIAESNREARKLVCKMGFTEEARLLDAHPDGDLIFFTMTPDRCRFIGEKYGQRFAVAAPGT